MFNLFKFFRKLGTAGAGGDVQWIYARCDRCGEKFKVALRRQFDLSPTYEDAGPAYIWRKELLGVKCPNLIRVEMNFDSMRNILNKSIDGGEFIAEDDYEASES
ncbi:MAG: hypothetical protein ACUVXI_12860 [bacterium]